MLNWLKPKNDNAWTATDRQERVKLILATTGLAIALLAGLGFLIYALTAS